MYFEYECKNDFFDVDKERLSTEGQGQGMLGQSRLGLVAISSLGAISTHFFTGTSLLNLLLKV